MKDLVLVQNFESSDDLNENTPDFIFFEPGLFFLVPRYFLK